MGRSEYHAFNLVLPKSSLRDFKKMVKSHRAFSGTFGMPSSNSDFILEEVDWFSYSPGSLFEEEEEEVSLPEFYEDFLLEPPEGYETISVEFQIKGWFEEGIQGILGYLQEISDGEALLIAGGSVQSSGDCDDPYEVLFEVKDIKKLKEEKKGENQQKDSATTTDMCDM